MKVRSLKLALAAALLLPATAMATNGYFSHGYGMKNKGRGGASTAATDDSFGGANNPAQMVWVGSRLDVGVDWFRPQRSAKREGSAGGTGFLDGSADGNEKENFFIPEFGYNYMMSPDWSLGVSVYGNGGMNTNYPSGQLDPGICFGGPPAGVKTQNLLCGNANLGVDLSQLIIAPTVAFKFAGNHSAGVAPLIGIQRFKAYGLQPFAAISADPANLTNVGYEWSYGIGVRIGYLGKFLDDRLSIGAAYSSKLAMSEFDKYRGLFAEQGDFDIPSNWNLGVAFKITPAWTVLGDYQRINYSDVKAVHNPSNQPNCNPMPNFPFGPGVGPDCLGASGSSIGFGWQDVDIWKIGVEWQATERWLLRAGYDHTDNPIGSRDVTFNILAPGVVQDHLTLGFTYTLQGGSEITAAYMHAFDNSVSGPANNPYFPVGGTETIKMYQDSLGVAWGMKF